MSEPILLAFSGGLDTVLRSWLKETYGRPVITVTVDTAESMLTVRACLA